MNFLFCNISFEDPTVNHLVCVMSASSIKINVIIINIIIIIIIIIIIRIVDPLEHGHAVKRVQVPPDITRVPFDFVVSVAVHNHKGVQDSRAPGQNVQGSRAPRHKTRDTDKHFAPSFIYGDWLGAPGSEGNILPQKTDIFRPILMMLLMFLVLL